MDRIRRLDPDLLARLEQLLDAADPGLLGGAAPGLSTGRMAELAASAGLELPNEAQSWWGWRNGSPRRTLPYLDHLSLETSVEQYQHFWRRMALDISQDPQTAEELRDPDFWWAPEWLPLFTTGGRPTIVLDCSPSSASAAAVRQIDWELVPIPSYNSVLAPSLGEYLLGFANDIEAGVYHYDSPSASWVEASHAENRRNTVR